MKNLVNFKDGTARLYVDLEKKPLEIALKEHLKIYECVTSQKPDVVVLSERQFREPPEFPGIKVLISKYINPNNYYIGQEENGRGTSILVSENGGNHAG